MRTPFTAAGRRWSLRSRRRGRSTRRGCAASPAPGRGGGALPRPLRPRPARCRPHPRGEAPRRRDRGRGGAGPRAGAGRGRRVRHARRSSRRRGRCRKRGRAASSPSPLLQQAHPDGLFRHYQAIAEATPLRSSSTTCRADGMQRGPRDPRPARHDPRLVGVKGGLRQHDQICEVPERRPRRTSSSSPGTTPSPCPPWRSAPGASSRWHRTRRRARWRVSSRPPSGTIRGRREMHARLLPLMLGELRGVEPHPVKAAMAQMGLLEET